MNRLAVVTAVVALLVGVLAGFLWWGIPTRRLATQLTDTQSRAERLERELGELRGRLRTETSRLEAAEKDLSREKAMNQRLQLLVSQGKK